MLELVDYTNSTLNYFNNITEATDYIHHSIDEDAHWNLIDINTGNVIAHN